MMANFDLDSILKKAREQEEKYGWLFAAWSYEHAIRSYPENNLFNAEFGQQIGFCYKLAARQSENEEEFNKLQLLSVKAYRDSEKHFQIVKDIKILGRAEYCAAQASFLEYKLESTFENKTKSLNNCQSFAKNALNQFQKTDYKLYVGM
ncbi:MAG: hypothetical protein P8X91_06230 [Candidatus Bathyarchaeota archaeon]